MERISDDKVVAMTGRHIGELPTGYRDITLCAGDRCQRTKSCRRYLMYVRSLADGNEYVYMMDRTNVKGECNEFWDDTEL